MGASDMAASAPEEGRKCWLKATFDNKSRMIEWNSNWTTFKEMDTKVRRMFGLNDKLRLTYTYQETSTHSDIIMSSDEELSTALSLISGSILLLDVYLEKKKQKSPVYRLMRAAKAQRPQVAEFLANLHTNVLAHVPAIPLSTVVERMRACGQSAAACASARFRCRRNSAEGAPAAPCMRSHKVLLGLLVLLLAMGFAHMKCSHHRRGDWMHNYHNHHNGPFAYNFQYGGRQAPSHVTILAATYGGMDVTRKMQEFYNQYGVVKAANSLFGDPTVGQRKHLHVVYQYIGKNGIAEVFSQSFAESDRPESFSMARESCAFPEEAIVDGRSVKVLGALFDDVTATCSARRLAATGRFTATKTHKDNFVHRTHFGSSNGNGVYTMVYLKDNTLQMITAREGNSVSF